MIPAYTSRAGGHNNDYFPSVNIYFLKSCEISLISFIVLFKNKQVDL